MKRGIIRTVMNQNRKVVFLGAACLLGAVWLAGCGKSKAKEDAADTEAPTPVTVETAVRGAIDRVISTDAVLYPVNQAPVSSKISAPVTRVLVNRGDHVRAGQLLVVLESADLAAAANESQYQYQQAQANYDLVSGATVVDDRSKAEADVQTAQDELNAAKKLYDNRAAAQKEGALPQKLVDEARLSMQQAQVQLTSAQKHLQSLNDVSQKQSIRAAQASMNAAKAHYDNASVQLGYAQVKSPIAGVVADRSIYPGDTPVAGTPMLSIVDISQVVARANVPVKDASYIKVGRPARLSGPEGDIPGVVTVVSPAVDPTTTTVQVWVKADNPGEKLRPGATVHVAIIAETIQDTVVVPVSALLNGDEGGQKVMVIDKDNVAHEHMVSVGVRQGDRVQIVSGVSEGDQVVTTGGLGLDDKAKVTVQQPKSEDEDEDSDDEDSGK